MRALNGRPTFLAAGVDNRVIRGVTALQAWWFYCRAIDPGRCPGLSYFAPLGLTAPPGGPSGVSQVSHSPNSFVQPKFDGAWLRAFDFKRLDYWASDSDDGWGVIRRHVDKLLPSLLPEPDGTTPRQVGE